MFNVVSIIFKIYIIETKLDFVSFNDNLKILKILKTQKFVGERDFPIQNSKMFEAQQAPEIRDVISAKRYYFLFHFNSRSLCGGERSVWFGQKFFSKLTPVIEFFSLSFFRVCKTINSMQEFRVESTMFAHGKSAG